jgi:excisionase family DNA binding protein
MPRKPQPEVMSVNEARKYLKKRHTIVMALVESGEIPARKIGCQYRISKAALDQWLARGDASASSSE